MFTKKTLTNATLVVIAASTFAVIAAPTANASGFGVSIVNDNGSGGADLVMNNSTTATYHCNGTLKNRAANNATDVWIHDYGVNPANIPSGGTWSEQFQAAPGAVVDVFVNCTNDKFHAGGINDGKPLPIIKSFSYTMHG